MQEKLNPEVKKIDAEIQKTNAKLNAAAAQYSKQAIGNDKISAEARAIHKNILKKGGKNFDISKVPSHEKKIIFACLPVDKTRSLTNDGPCSSEDLSSLLGLLSKRILFLNNCHYAKLA